MTNVVIGAASGMGAATARKLAPRGRLFVADYNLEGAQKIAAEIGGDIRAFACDISNQAQVDALMREVAGVARVFRAAEPLLRKGTVGVAVASQSGYMVPEAPELFAAIDDNLAPDMIDNVAKFIDVDNSSLCYQLSKRAVHRMARRLSFAWGAKGARILSLSPGITDTPMGRGEEAKNPIMLKMVDSSPLSRHVTPEEIANVIAFITSPEASAMTGSDVLVDGGMRNILPMTTWDGKIRVPERA
jgi:NAD(P)-dependent dehydrogenase (short-subunit alcohol dehydrogenase family)